MIECKKVPRNEEFYDVIVVGGGTAGWVAALAAARQKKRVLLLERNGYLGGALSSGIPILGFHDSHHRQVVKGYAHEFVEALQKVGGAEDYHLSELWHNSLVGTNPAMINPVIFKMLKTNGVQIIMFSQVVDVVVDDDKIVGVLTQNRSDQSYYWGKAFVDASGDANLVYHSGVEMQKIENLQPPTLVFMLQGVNIKKLREYLVNHPEGFVDWRMKPGHNISPNFLNTTQMFFLHPELIEKVETLGDYVPLINRFMFHTTPDGNGVVVNMLRAHHVDGTNSASVSQATVDLYLNLLPLVEAFRKYIPGFESCYLCHTVPDIQLRETRRILGEYTMVVEDVVNNREFPDNIARGSYFIDVHHSGTGSGTWRRTEGSYGIPYRALLPKGLEGVVVAGRCISGTKEAAGSYRVMATCMAMGQAAGTAAAISVDKGISPKEVATKELQEILSREGAIL